MTALKNNKATKDLWNISRPRATLRDEPLFFERNPKRARRQGLLLPPLDVPDVEPAEVLPADRITILIAYGSLCYASTTTFEE